MGHFHLTIIFLGLILFSCKNSGSVQEIKIPFQFSYFDVKPTSYSVQVGPADSMFLLQYFTNNTSNKLLANQTYFAILDSRQKTHLGHLLENIRLKTYQTTYPSHDLDGKNLLFCFFEEDSVDSIELSDRSGPKELQALWKWIETEKEALRFAPIDKKINWKVGPPPPPLPTNKGG